MSEQKIEKLDLRSADLTAGNIAKIAELFPSVVTETRAEDGTVRKGIDFDALRQELSDHVIDGPQERYQLDWPGKRAAKLASNAPIAKTLRPDRDESVDFDTTENLFIEGDNLDALKLLQESYLGKVKMIYIDPPYNTGNDFVYNDDFAESAQEYLERSGQVDSEGQRLVANKEANGRFHSDWLSMMYPRLKLARNLLTRDGAVFLSIDDNEVASLRQLCDEVFGPSNFIATLVWSAGRKNDSRFISVSHEYVLCYARDLDHLRQEGVTWKTRKKGLDAIYAQAADLRTKHGDDYAAATAALKAWYKKLPADHESKKHKHYSHIDARGVFFPDNISWPGGGGPSYEVLHPATQAPVKKPSGGWRFQRTTMNQLIAEDRVRFGATEETVPTVKRYLSDTESEALYSVIYQDGRAASKRLSTLMGGKVFDYPKDETILQTLIEMVTGPGDIVMDFFAGSGSTGHAVIALNARDGGGRPFILVQLPETPSPKSEAAKRGYDNIAAVSRERLRRAAAQLRADADGSDFDGGFRALRVDSSNMRDTHRSPEALGQLDLEGLTDTVEEGRTAEDLLFQVLLDWGLELSVPIEEKPLGSGTVFDVDHGALLACFDTEVSLDTVRAMAAEQPARLVFRDSAFTSDAERINAQQLVTEFAPSADLKTI